MQLSDVLPGTFEDKAYGAIIGSCVGDSCGSYIYKSPKQIYETQIQKQYMDMNGGGNFVQNMGGGQISTGQETMLCLLDGLINSYAKSNNMASQLHTDEIAKMYK